MPRRLPDHDCELIDALRLSQQDQELILREMNAAPAATGGREKRKSRRLPYKGVTGLIMRVTHPGGTTVRFLVKPRNISTHGLSVLHGGFIHPETRCAIPLRDLMGNAVRMDGRVVSCRLVRGRVHEVGVQFDRAIPLEQYVLDADMPEAGADGVTPIALPTLAGRVLVADEWADDRRLVSYDLQKLGIEPTEADGGADALRRIRSGHFDALLTGEWLGDMTAADFAGAARERGCTTPIIGVFAAGADAGLRAAATTAGVGTIIDRPYPVERLAQLLMQFLSLDSPRSGSPERADLSEKWVEPGMRPMILAFLQGMEIRLGDLERQLQELAGGHDVMGTCLRLKGAAASYGFPRLSKLAEDLAQGLSGDEPLERLQATLNELGGAAAAALEAAQREVDQA
jgi:CheY-like chemotaxis protein/HPt (histidine-containing phosphotransfer) domain-containing protein